jgi:hypothetical protein
MPILDQNLTPVSAAVIPSMKRLDDNSIPPQAAARHHVVRVRLATDPPTFSKMADAIAGQNRSAGQVKLSARIESGVQDKRAGEHFTNCLFAGCGWKVPEADACVTMDGRQQFQESGVPSWLIRIC